MKTTQVLKAILIGALAGASIFFIPFPFRFLLGFLLIFFAFLFFAFGRRGRWNNGYAPYQFMHQHAYAERWRNMSDDERKAFIKKMESELFAGKTTTE